MSEFLYKHSLVNEEPVESGIGFHLTWDMLEGALLEKGEMDDSEEVFQVGLREGGITLFVRDK